MPAMEWNGDIIQVMAEDDDIAYVVPTEGSLMWQDTMAIPTGAPHPENAHAFINFVLGRGGRASALPRRSSMPPPTPQRRS